MSEPKSRRRRGRGIDAIFDTADLDLETTPETQTPSQRTKRQDPRPQEDPPFRRGRGRPRRTQEAPTRELVQRGFYLEPEQDRMIDEIKVGLKTRGFNPDRSAIIRAAVKYFHELDKFAQEERVRRAK